MATQDQGNAAAARPRPGRNRPSPCAAERHHAYLAGLGERVRTFRVRRGMTRRILARDSSVSERYLAQLESGQGNISIALLRQVAEAMGAPLEDLVRDGPERPVELTVAIQRLERLDPQELATATEMLARGFGRTADRDRSTRIALIGLRAAGKSTLGQRLADHLGVPFVEMNQEIERDSGMSLSEIFSLSGQAAYRRYERRAMERVIDSYPRAVIATGGSLVSEPATFELLLSACFSIWLRAAPEEHMARAVAQGDMRPMLDTDEALEDLRRILAERQPFYARADREVDTAGRSVEESFRDLTAALPPESLAAE